MGGSSKKQTVGYKYYLGQHLLLTTNRIAIQAIKFQDKLAWTGNAAGGQQLTINKPSLFGGESREGGVSGKIDFLDGDANQGVNDYLAGFINPLPAFRFVTSIVMRGFYIGNNYYIKPPTIKAADTQISRAWEPQIGTIGGGINLSGANVSIFLDDSTSMNTNGVTALSRNAAAAFLRRIVDPNNVQVHLVQGPTSVIEQRIGATASDYEELAQFCEGLSDAAAGPAFLSSDVATSVVNFSNSTKTENLPFEQAQEVTRLFAEFTESETDRRNVAIILTDGGVTDSGAAGLSAMSSVNNLEVYGFQFTDGSVNAELDALDNSPIDSVPLIPSNSSPQFAASTIEASFSEWNDINPVHIIYDMLTARIDRTNTNTDRIGNSFKWVAQRLFDEGFGMSIYWRNRRELAKLRDLVQNHIDGRVYFSRDTGKWEIKLVRDDMGVNNEQAIYVAMDSSPSMTASRIATQRDGVVEYINSLRATQHSVRLSFFALSELSFIERFDCSDADYDDLIAFVEAGSASTNGTLYSQAVDAAPQFYVDADLDYKKMIIITDGEPSVVGDEEIARNTLTSVFGLISYVVQIDETTTTSSSRISNLHSGMVPVVNSGDSSGLAGFMKSATTAPVFDDTNVVQWKDDLTLQTPANLTNQMTLKYRRQDNGEERAITVQDHASIAIYGETIQGEADYQGIYNARIAGEIAQRDLRGRSSPKASGTIVVNSAPPGFGPGDFLVVNNPRLGFSNRVCRAVDVIRRTSVNRDTTIKFIEDTFSLQHVPEIEVATVEEPSGEPVSPIARYVEEVPYYLAVLEEGQFDTDDELADNPTIGRLMALASPADDDQYEVELATNQIDGWNRDGSFQYVLCVETSSDMEADPTDNTVTVVSSTNLADVLVNDLAVVNGEFVRIDGYDPLTSTLTIGRGCLDTPPRSHASGSKIILNPDEWFTDERDYSDGESIDVKLLSISNLGRQDFSLSPTDTVNFRSRANAPYPSGNVQVNLQYGYSDLPDPGPYNVTWAHRDRIFQTTPIPESYEQGDIGPETGVSYRLEVIYRSDTADLLTVVDEALAGTATSFEVADDIWAVRPDDATHVAFVVSSLRDGQYNTFEASVRADVFAPVVDLTVETI